MTSEARIVDRPSVDGPFPGLVFDHVVGIGGNCETAHQLRRHGLLRRSVFDWLVTPLDAIPRVLADDGSRLGTEFVTCHGGTSVRCGAYDVLYHHEFPRDDGNAVRFDAAALERCRSKMTHKWSRFVDLCEGGGRVLFLRFDAATDLPWDLLRDEPQRAATSVAACVEAVARRFPALDFRVLLLLTDGLRPAIDDPRVGVRLLPRDGSEGWAVSDASWSTLLRSLDIRAVPADGALGETLYWSGEAEDVRSSVAETSHPVNAQTMLRGVPALRTDNAGDLRASLAAATRLRGAMAAAKPGDEATAQTAAECLAIPTLSPQLCQMAGLVLQACGRDEEALAALLDARRRAPGLPDLDGQVAGILARLGRNEEALAHLRRAASAEPFRPHLLRRLTMLEATAGDADAALDTLAAALEFKVEPATLAVDAGRALWAAHRSYHAARAFDLAFAAGAREATFLRDHLGLLTGETRYADVLATAAAIGPFDDGRVSQRTMLAAHARLALTYERATEIAAAELREQSSEWLGTDALLATVREHLDERRPFSFIRLGDGEARFLIASRPDLRPQLAEAEARAIGEVVWDNWFGETLAAADPAALASLAADYVAAVRNADVIGASDAIRLRQDTGHYGYLAFQEHWLRGIAAERGSVLWTSAFAHRDLERATPGLAALLEGQDTLGLISPHPGLADRLAARFDIADVVDIVIPAEGRLPTAPQSRANSRHFPEVYRHVLATLVLPRPGCLVLVAGGLLGKVYCDRVRTLGGIALDIGALADAWMGHDTRDGQFAHVKRLG